jgi:hypothetical protein
MMHPFHDMPLGCDLGLRLGNLRLQTAGIKAGHYLPFLHSVPFLHQYSDNALTVVERQLHLPQVHVPIKDEFLRRPFVLSEPPPNARRAGGDN